ncbi:DegT/DnrJ/EryC1/StrS family aminotransferase [Pelagibacterales bacterium SAG-MED39]|nr:DegT/DnrJ/EryC1/StrS family aminotransferase [Pelagibacterales bacterium SAG-MED39]
MISKNDFKFLEKLLDKSNKSKIQKSINYPLLEKGFTNEDIIKGIEVLLSRKLTMSEITKKFEHNFSKFVGSKYALMVNSGSSANLLSAFALINPKKKRRLKPGDKFIVPAICWSTSLWPLVQCGLKPEFIDVNIENYCLDETLLKKKK